MELNVISEDNVREIRQRLAMSLFYFSTNMPNFFLMNLWLTSESECLWLGVVCNELGFVTKIELSGFGIEGHIPNLLLPLLPSLGTWLKLQALTPPLYKKQIASHIGFLFICSFRVLWKRCLSPGGNTEALDLSENKLTGHIPISLYSTLSIGKYEWI